MSALGHYRTLCTAPFDGRFALETSAAQAQQAIRDCVLSLSELSREGEPDRLRLALAPAFLLRLSLPTDADSQPFVSARVNARAVRRRLGNFSGHLPLPK
jgi:hypothetical protein